MRGVRWASGIVVLLGVMAAVAVAQTPVPTVAVSAGKGTVTPPAGAVAPGPTRFEFTRSGSGDVEVFLVTLRAGVSVEQVRQVINSERVLGLVVIEAGTSLSNQRKTAALTVDLRANTTYAAVSIVGNTSVLAPFTTSGTANGATAPAPDARIRMFSYGFRGSATLPRTGRIRVDNEGDAFHFALAFPVKRGVKAKRIGRAFRSGSEKAVGRVVAGPPVEVQGVISPTTTNVQEVTFPRAGRYTLVCFFGEHNRLGMYRIVRVR